MKQRLFLICLAAGLVVSGCVAPDQYRLLENRVAAIEAESNEQASVMKAEETAQMEQLRAELTEAVTASRQNYADVKYELEQVRERFHQIEGTIEEMRHTFGSSSQDRQEQLEKELERLDAAISQNYERVIALEKYMGFEPTKPLPPGSAKDTETAAAEAPDTEKGLYDLAKRMFDQGDTEGARLQFENFINTYPDSKNADNARFWIAESFYAEKWFEKAILEYQKVLETYPDSNKTAAARLKQGYAFAELGEKANARLILKELIKRHPDSNEAKYAAEKLKSLN